MFWWTTIIVSSIGDGWPVSTDVIGRAWSTTFSALSQTESLALKSGVESHIADPQALHCLENPFSPFHAPTPQTKASFETKTSAINLAPSPHGCYDIQQIKDDSLWLSKETNIDEVAALRITVLEWQSRPAFKLLREDLGDTAKVAGNASSQVAFAASQSSLLASSSFVGRNATTNFDAVNARRERLLEVYLSERRSILKTCEHIVFAALCDPTSPESKGKNTHQSGWIVKLGQDILSAWNIYGNVRDTRKNFFIVAIEAIELRLQSLESGCGWLQDEGSRDKLEMAFARNQILEMIHTMQIILMLLESSTKISRSDVCLRWFRLMASFGFFEDLQPVCLYRYSIVMSYS